MADPTNPGASGNLDFSTLSSDLSTTSQSYDARVDQERAAEKGYQTQSLSYSEQAATESEKAAGQATADDEQMMHYLDNTPSRQASYATSMHAAPVLALLTALGGKATRLSGGNMLAATNGIIQGLNTAAENKYQDAYKAWMTGYQKLKEHQAALMNAHKLMLDAYAGRADAYQKAADAARRMTGDLLTQKQEALSQRINSFKAQSEAMNRLDRVALAVQSLHERNLKDIAQIDHWKQVEKKGGDPATKQQLQVLKSRWTNLKSQVDEAMKQRGQINSNLNLSADTQAQLQSNIDARIEALEASMDQTQSAADALVAAPQVTPGNSTGAPIAPGAGRTGAITRPGSPEAPQGTPQTPDSGSGQVNPKRMDYLKQHQGQQVTFGDGMVAIMAADGTVSVIKGATVH